MAATLLSDSVGLSGSLWKLSSPDAWGMKDRPGEKQMLQCMARTKTSSNSLSKADEWKHLMMRTVLPSHDCIWEPRVRPQTASVYKIVSKCQVIFSSEFLTLEGLTFALFSWSTGKWSNFFFKLQRKPGTLFFLLDSTTGASKNPQKIMKPRSKSCDLLRLQEHWEPSSAPAQGPPCLPGGLCHAFSSLPCESVFSAQGCNSFLWAACLFLFSWECSEPFPHLLFHCCCWFYSIQHLRELQMKCLWI